MKSIIQKIIIEFLFYFNKRKSLRFELPGLLATNKKVLFFIPDDKNLTGIIKSYLDSFTSSFGIAYLYLEEKLTPFYCTNPKLKLISYSYKTENRIGLPTNSMIHELDLEHFDIIVDLNMEMSYYHLYLLYKLNPFVRIGFSSKDADRHYNFQIKVDDSKNTEYIYSQIFSVFNLL